MTQANELVVLSNDLARTCKTLIHIKVKQG